MKGVFIQILLLISCEIVSAKEVTLVLKTETGVLKGTLELPDNVEKIPLVFMISGEGGMDRDGNMPSFRNNCFKMLADSLSKHKIASFRYDKRGTGESVFIKNKFILFDDHINDAKQWLEMFKHDRRFSEIIMLGHSEGALIALKVAESVKVSKYISLEGIGVSGGDYMRRQIVGQPVELQSACFPIIDQLEKGKQVDEIPYMVYDLFKPIIQPYLISWMRYSPTYEIAELTIPALLIHGTTDIQIPVYDAELLNKAYPAADLIKVEGMNHVLKSCPSMDEYSQLGCYSNPQLPLHPILVDIMVSYILIAD